MPPEAIHPMAANEHERGQKVAGECLEQAEEEKNVYNTRILSWPSDHGISWGLLGLSPKNRSSALSPCLPVILSSCQESRSGVANQP